ncbi:MAG: 1-deoxy-D-xylulose-5-phosphate reductoisomerase [Dehalococcoidia bacterium]|nr:1-deoxy-D-xylulose-5-phosphate reductoisomerase [Dehalococcoidia bacterium]
MGRSMKGVAVLGSTGSIGTQTLSVLRGLAPEYGVVALAAGQNVALLAQQVAEFKPKLIYAEAAGARQQLTGALSSTGAWATPDEMAAHPDVDLVIVGTSGKAGLAPTLAALRAGKDVALANKEVLVMAGELVMAEARRSGAAVRPVDSEHSAIWQCVWGEEPGALQRIILTASGGAFRDRPLEELRQVTPAEALRHPTWNMGAKITVDCATLMNKGMETIEARWLFDVPLERVDVVLHRESIVHSMVEMRDGSVKAQLGLPDMRLPIRCAITYPERLPFDELPRLDLAAIGTLTFDRVDLERFPCLGLAMAAGRAGGTHPAAMAAADEVAVGHFLAGRIGFMDIAPVVEQAIAAHRAVAAPDLEAVLAIDAWARRYTDELVAQRV